ncbi:MAG: hypothetical protein ABI642_04535 [Polaromonas sp.]
MGITKRLEEFFRTRLVLGTAILAKARNKGRSPFPSEPAKAEPAPPTMSEQAKANASFAASASGQPQPAAAPPAPEPEQSQALGASALLDAWKERESALGDTPDPPKPDGLPFAQNPSPSAQSASASRPVETDPRRPTSFAPWFVVIAAAAGLGGWLLLNTGPSDLSGRERPNAARTGPAEPVAVQLVMCPSEPVVPVAGEKDGKFPMQADVAGLAVVDIASFVVLSNEASAEGRARDAEVGLLMSCRIADKLKGAASVESADAKYRLGRHYADLSLRANPAAAPNRAEWLARAQILLADSLLTYSTRFGDNDDRSRLAASGLASVRQGLAQKMQPEPALAVAPVAPVAPVRVVPAVAPVLAASPGASGVAAAVKLPAPSRPDRAAQPPARPSPAIQAREKPRPTPPALKECPPAVETLGLCN